MREFTCLIVHWCVDLYSELRFVVTVPFKVTRHIFFLKVIMYVVLTTSCFLFWQSKVICRGVCGAVWISFKANYYPIQNKNHMQFGSVWITILKKSEPIQIMRFNLQRFLDIQNVNYIYLFFLGKLYISFIYFYF